ncbi:glycosyltransferase family 2 protein [Polynucleobacter paneuropaeus]|nr:glycosyltransferase family 2 protein [Polynucleobacter paneuropaeus]
MAKKVSIVVPIYNEAGNILNLHSRLGAVVASLPQFEWEYIFVNDGSSDCSFEVLENLASANKNIKVLDFSRNFGKEIALTAGAHEAEHSDALICIDADLQHPPELIPTLITKWEEGAEVVVTIRTEIEKQPILRQMGSCLYYWLMRKMSGIDLKAKTTDFRLYDKKVVKAFMRATERERMFRGIMDWMGFRRSYVEFKADARAEGQAAYSYAKLWRLAVNSLTAFSLWPLRLAGYMGILISTISGGLFIWMLVNYLVLKVWIYTPLAMTVVINTFLIGVVLMSLGLVALYVGIIHTEVINRPLYILREKTFPREK